MFSNRGSGEFLATILPKVSNIQFLKTGPDPAKKFQSKILLYAGLWPITEIAKGHVTDAIGRIPPHA